MDRSFWLCDRMRTYPRFFDGPSHRLWRSTILLLNLGENCRRAYFALGSVDFEFNCVGVVGRMERAVFGSALAGSSLGLEAMCNPVSRLCMKQPARLLLLLP